MTVEKFLHIARQYSSCKVGYKEHRSFNVFANIDFNSYCVYITPSITLKMGFCSMGANCLGEIAGIVEGFCNKNQVELHRWRIEFFDPVSSMSDDFKIIKNIYGDECFFVLSK